MRSVITSMAVLGISALTGSAGAAYHTYAGDECVVWAGSACQFNYGACENPGSGTQYVDCPAHKTSAFSSAYIVTKDRNPTLDLKCQLCHFYPYGGTTSLIGTCESWNLNTDSTGTFQWLYTGPSDISVPYSYEYYYLSCEVPGLYGGNRSGIQSYVVIES